jgi:hypothetical protein
MVCFTFSLPYSFFHCASAMLIDLKVNVIQVKKDDIAHLVGPSGLTWLWELLML